MLLVLFAVLGLCFGSFINAWVWRSRRKINVVSGRSICPACKHQLSALDLIPVLSWLALRGHCRYCHKPISAQYPLVELLTAALFVVSYLHWDYSGYLSVLGIGFWLIELTCLLTLAVYDLKYMILPNQVMRTLAAVAFVNLGVLALLGLDGWYLLNHLAAAVLGGGFFYALFGLSAGRWMGGGDVKLAFIMGLLLGTQALLVALFIGFNLAALLSIGLMLLRKLGRKDLIPFGPFLIAGTVIAAWYTPSLVGWYLRLVNLA